MKLTITSMRRSSCFGARCEHSSTSGRLIGGIRVTSHVAPIHDRCTSSRILDASTATTVVSRRQRRRAEVGERVNAISQRTRRRARKGQRDGKSRRQSHRATALSYEMHALYPAVVPILPHSHPRRANVPMEKSTRVASQVENCSSPASPTTRLSRSRDGRS